VHLLELCKDIVFNPWHVNNIMFKLPSIKLVQVRLSN